MIEHFLATGSLLVAAKLLTTEDTEDTEENLGSPVASVSPVVKILASRDKGLDHRGDFLNRVGMRQQLRGLRHILQA
jgi:hypothetical protein